MNFTERIQRENEDIIEAIIADNFVREMVAGTLPKKVFHYYIAQDIAYLYNFAKAAALCASKADPGDLGLYTSMQNAALEEISAIDGHYSRLEEFTPPPGRTPACLHYGSFILSLAQAGPAEVAFAGLYPCPWLYMHIGQRFGQNVPEAHPYAHWLLSNGDPSYPRILEPYDALLNRYGEGPFAEEMSKAARAAFFHEYYFWKDAFNLKDFYRIS